jgi:crotonobetainyl-CoA:carnitine CoA-transferase CaiB-like acyl-CoA transferase
MAGWQGHGIGDIEARAGHASSGNASVGAPTGNPIFSNENRGKKGVVLNVAKPEGRA